MSNSSLLFRSLIIYGVCLVLALFVGYQLATWDEQMSFYSIILLLALMVIPMLLRWHQFWLIASWNLPVVLFFFKGHPSLLWVLIVASLLISVLHHTLNRQTQFIPVRSIVFPLLFLAGLTFLTARLTGGIGLNAAGSANIGGKRYLSIFFAIAGYFALTARPIPPTKVKLYVACFFLGGLAMAVSDLAYFVPYGIGSVIPLLFIPPDILWDPSNNFVGGSLEIPRLGGVAIACIAGVTAMLVFYGVAGIFNSRKLWRAVLFMALSILSLFGGFRSMLIGLVLTAALVFWLEGSMRTRLMPALVGLFILGAAIAFPFTDKLPFSIQRAISFIPFVKVQQAAADTAKGSTEWRLQMWKEVLPEVPKYLVIGKGYSISMEEFEAANSINNPGAIEASILSGDYHSGPLSLIIPLGIGGVIGFIWLLGAGIKVLYHNYRYGDQAFQRINTYLLAAFIGKALFFLAIFGSFHSDLIFFTGTLGLSVAINGGMRQPVPAPKKQEVNSMKLMPAHAQAIH